MEFICTHTDTTFCWVEWGKFGWNNEDDKPLRLWASEKKRMCVCSPGEGCFSEWISRVCLRGLFALKTEHRNRKANIFSSDGMYQHNWSEYLNCATGNNSHLSKIEIFMVDGSTFGSV